LVPHDYIFLLIALFTRPLPSIPNLPTPSSLFIYFSLSGGNPLLIAFKKKASSFLPSADLVLASLFSWHLPFPLPFPYSSGNISQVIQEWSATSYLGSSFMSFFCSFFFFFFCLFMCFQDSFPFDFQSPQGMIYLFLLFGCLSPTCVGTSLSVRVFVFFPLSPPPSEVLLSASQMIGLPFVPQFSFHVAVPFPLYLHLPLFFSFTPVL